MSGAEFLAVIGGIGAILSIADAIMDIYKTVKDIRGLPEAFSVVAGCLPNVKAILESTKRHIYAVDDEAVCKGIRHIVEQCETNADTLKSIFEEVKPDYAAWKVERYYKAVKARGKGHKVETLMANILEDIQLLDSQHGMNTATEDQQKEILAAIKELSQVPTSVPDSEFYEVGVTMNQSGSGTQQYTAKGNVYSSGGGKQFNAERQYFDNSLESAEDRCLSTLFLTDPRDDREKLVHIKGSRVEGTGEWIRSNALYDSWLRSYSQLLWLSGGPGKGKTMLSVFLAEELERTANDSQNVLFLQYFCDNKNEKRNTAIAIIRGLIFQLLQFRPKLFNHILPSFKIQKESLFDDSSFATLWRIFSTMLRDPVLGAVQCVLDGLDECDEASLRMLLGKFEAFFSPKTGVAESSACHFNLIVVSRDRPDFIPEMLSKFPQIRLDPDVDKEVNNDIHRFIEAKIDELSIYKQYSELLRGQMKRVFQDRAQGTFLWVGIVAQELRKYKATEVEKALDLFPSGLEELYARMLRQINLDRRDTAARMLLWVVLAIRPLTLAELSVAIDVNPSMGFSWDEVIRDQISYCGYFLTIKEDEVGLIHQSVRDYLLRETPDPNPELEFFRVEERVGDLEITRKCLDYLQRNSDPEGKKVDLKDVVYSRAFPLFTYAALYWPEHARTLARSEDVFDLSYPFYQRNSLARESWLKTYWPVKELVYPPTSFTLLHLASCFGILPLAETILNQKGLINKVKRRLDLNKKDSFGGTALYWAARSGHEAVVRLLLEKGADVKAKDKDRLTTLYYSARGGHDTVAQLLLEKGADVEAKDKDGWTALHWAAHGGHNTVAQLLLEKGADVEAKDKDGRTALHRAAHAGHDTVVRLLNSYCKLLFTCL